MPKVTLPELVAKAVDEALAEGPVVPEALAEQLIDKAGPALRAHQQQRSLDELTRAIRGTLRRRADSVLTGEQLDLGLPDGWVLAVTGPDLAVEYVLASAAREDELLAAEAHREVLVKDAETRVASAGESANRRLQERVRDLEVLRELLRRLAGDDGAPA